MWGYRWVSATYPEADDEGRREYTFQFTESAFVLKCGDRVGSLFLKKLTYKSFFRFH